MTPQEIQEMMVEALRQDDLDALRRSVELGADVTASDCLALRSAALYGTEKCLPLLIEMSDVNAKSGEALRNALTMSHVSLAKMLLPSSNVEIVRRDLEWKNHSPAISLLDALLLEEKHIGKVSRVADRRGV